MAGRRHEPAPQEPYQGEHGGPAYSYPRPDPPRPPAEPVTATPAPPPPRRPTMAEMLGGRFLHPGEAEAPGSTEMRGPEQPPSMPRSADGIHFRTSAGGPPNVADKPVAVHYPQRSTSN